MKIKQEILETNNAIDLYFQDIREVLVELAYSKSNSEKNIAFMVDNTINHIKTKLDKINHCKDKLRWLENPLFQQK
jgi:hypothetical protein